MNDYLIDTHAHIYLNKKSEDEIIQQALKNKVKKIIVPGIDIETSIKAGELAKKYPGTIFAAFGIHPSEYVAVDEAIFLDITKKYPFVAIGEIGLDYYHMTHPKEAQLELFEKQMGLAKRLNLPVLIHNRQADDDMAKVLAKYSDVAKLMHCYSSDVEFARKIDDEMTYFSFAGQITYSKKGKIIRAIRELPLDKIMIETDCPYLSPEKHKGTENEPAFMIETAWKIAEIKDISLEKVISTTTDNATRFFRL